MKKYVFGDLHGSLYALDKLLRLVDEHAAGEPHKKIFLGDYVDRGAFSCQVIERLMNLRGDCVFLKGNHEDMMIESFKEFERTGEHNVMWLVNGGMTTLMSYPNHQVGDDQWKWLNDLKLSYEDDLRYYVHAGINPLTTLANQTSNSQLWIRKGFIDCGFPFEKYIVHGHSVESTTNPVILHNRANMDTGGVFEGTFTVGVFDDSQEKPIDIIQYKNPTTH